MKDLYYTQSDILQKENLSMFKNIPLTELQKAYTIGRDEEEIATKVIYELIVSSIDVPRLENAINCTLKAQPALNCVISSNGFMQIKKSVEPYHIDIKDISNLSQDKQKNIINAEFQKCKYRVWNGKDGYPIYISSIILSNTDTRIIMDFDMLIFDGMSIKLFLDNVSYYYNNPDVDIVPDYSFFKYCLEKMSLKTSKAYLRAKEFWLKKIDDFPQAPNIPVINTNFCGESAMFDRKNLIIKGHDWNVIKQNIIKNNITPYVFMLAIYSKMLGLYSGSKRFTINVPIFNRKNKNQMIISIGDFTSVLLIDIDLNKKNMVELCKDINRKVVTSLKYRQFDGVELMRELSKRKGIESAKFPFVFTPMLYDDFKIASNTPFGVTLNGCSQTNNINLDCQIYEYQDDLCINLDYRVSAFDDDILNRMFKLFTTDIQKFSDVNTFFSESFLTNILEDDKSILVRYNQTYEDIPSLNLNQLLIEAHKKYKDKIIVSCVDDCITYGDLWNQSEKVRNYLWTNGIKVGDTVAVIGKRDIKTIINFLGVIRSGAIYVPIDEAQPKQRKDVILEKSKCSIVLDKSCNFDDYLTITQQPNVEYSPNDIAYIIFTSGSTGQPKGVYEKHCSAINTVLDINKRFNVTENDVISCVSSIGFDLSIYDIFSSLITGAELVLIPNVYDVKQMVSLLSNRGVTVWNSVPALFRLVTDFINNNRVSSDVYFDDYFSNTSFNENYILSLRLVMLSGDWIPKNIVSNAMKLFTDCKIVSLGGATEASIWSIYYEIDNVKSEWDSIPYGYPLSNQKMYILDENDCFAPIGAKGQICIGGIGVAEGYYNDKEKTKNLFYEVKNLGRVYHTGDYGTFSKDGYIIFQGRKDNQVKINGFRVELGEIENALKKLEYVKNAVVVINTSKNGAKSICAYISTYDDTTEKIVKNDVSQSLPYYMIPSKVVLLENLPLTSNGKVDRKNLPSVEEVEVSEETIMNSVQNKIVEIWKKYLQVEYIPLNKQFIELGGDSLAMISIVNEIKNHFGVEISFKKFMILGTVKNLANYIEENTDVNSESIVNKYQVVVYSDDEKFEPFPLTDIQMSYFIGRNSGIQMGGVSTHAYYEVENDFDIKRLTKSLNAVIQENSMLRMVVNDDGTQSILENVEWYEIIEKDISKFSKEEQEKILKEARDENSHKIFDVHTFPLFEFKAFRLNHHLVRLLVGFDLLVADGISMRIFIKELLQHYENDNTSKKEEKFTFRDYILSLNRLKSTSYYSLAKQYWENQIDTFSGSPNLPLLCKPSEVEKPIFKRYQHTINGDKWNTIKQKLLKLHITPSTFLMTVYGRILAYYSNMDSVTINVTVFTRFPFDKAVSTMIGDFTSVMLVDIPENGQYKDICNRIQNKITENLEYTEYDGISLIRKISQKQNRSGELLFPYVFTGMIFENQDNFNINNMGNLVYSVSQTSQVYLDCQVMNGDDGISITWDYVQQLFNPNMIEKMFNTFISIIESCGNAEIFYKEDIKFIQNYNNTQAEYDTETLIQAFENQVLKKPNNVAIITDDEEYTYSQIDEITNHIAIGLIDMGISKGDTVAVYEYRDVYTICSILAILKCGGAYVPISPNIPEERKKYIIENSKCQIQLTKDCVNQLKKTPLREVSFSKPDKKDVAYIIYTSGSTGLPKGVVMTHDGAMNTIIDINRKFNVTENDKLIGVSSFTFDLSVYDIFGALSSGASVVIAKDSKNPDELKRLVTEKSVTIWNSVPAIFELFLSKNTSEDTESYFDDIQHEVDVFFEDTETLRLVLLSGDYIPVDLPNRIKDKYINAEVISLGGATEGGIWSIYYPIKEVNDSWNTIPYGYPLSNQEIYVLNKNNEICPLDVEGEIVIGGQSLAQGYCNDEEKTKMAFIKHSSLGNIYKTGDMGIMKHEGYVEFCGRRDNQVKINGYRIELGEIESSILKYNGIKSAVAVVSNNNKNNIIAYFTSDSDILDSDIRDYISTHIPNYMLPSVIKRIHEMPITTNGKIDRKKLASMDSLSNDRKFIEPTTENEIILYQYFKECLGIEHFSITDNFFELGGDSIKGITLYNKINTIFDADINLIFRYQTVETLAKHLNKRNMDYLDDRIEKFRQEYYAVSDVEEINQVDDYYKKYLIDTYNRLKTIKRLTKRSYKNVLLTGATGYLGAYMLETLMTDTNTKVFLIVRGDNYIERVKKNLSFYFNDNFYTKYSHRIEILQGNLCLENLGLSKEDYNILCTNIDVIFNCAGKVQHFGKYNDFYLSNVKGVENLLIFSMEGKKKELCHMSTTRISETIKKDGGVLFYEDLYVEDNISNEFYVQSKKEAEDLILKYRKLGACASIFRIGTILFDSKNGQFQQNIEFNSFYLIMKSFFELSAMPDIDASILDFSFVDECSKAIINIAFTNELQNGTYHIYNPNKLSMRDFYEKLKSAGMKEQMNIMEFDEFFDFVYDKYKDDNFKDCIDTLLLHSGEYISIDDEIHVIVNDYTCEVLSKLGFKWSVVTENHISNMLDYGKKVSFFEME